MSTCLVEMFLSVFISVTCDFDVQAACWLPTKICWMHSRIACLYHSYDDEAEKVTQYERIALEDVDKIEIGERWYYPRHLSFHKYVLPTF